jgi:hypothetical protein
VTTAHLLAAALEECLPYFEGAQNRSLNDWRAADATRREAEAALCRAAQYRVLLAQAHSNNDSTQGGK